MVYLPPSTKSDLAGWIIVNSPETRWFMTNSWEMVGHDVINQVLGKNWQPGSKDSLLEPTISSCKLSHCKEIIRKSSHVHFLSESADTEHFQISRIQFSVVSYLFRKHLEIAWIELRASSFLSNHSNHQTKASQEYGRRLKVGHGVHDHNFSSVLVTEIIINNNNFECGFKVERAMMATADDQLLRHSWNVPEMGSMLKTVASVLTDLME